MYSLLTWNLNGGLKNNSIETMNKNMKPISILENGTKVISSFLREINPDIISLQEVHFSNSYNQAINLADILGYEYVDFFPLDNSHHISGGFKIGLSILSKYNIINSEHIFFDNPKLTSKQNNGDIWYSHDKGMISADIKLPYSELTFRIINLHLLPFHRFNIQISKTNQKQFYSDIEKKIYKYKKKYTIIAGDFNQSDILLVLPNMQDLHLTDCKVNTPTHNNKHIDHILFSNKLRLKKATVITDIKFSDHFPFISTFKET